MNESVILKRLLIMSFIMAGAAMLAIALAVGDRRQFSFSYLTAVLDVLTTALGCLFFVLLHFVTRSRWSVVVRRWAEQASVAIPVASALLLPLGFGLGALYPWADVSIVRSDPLLQHRQPVTNALSFGARTLADLLVWSALAWWFRRKSLQQDLDRDPRITRVLQAASAPALVLVGVTVTAAAFDWIMSLDRHWSSSIFGVYFFAGSVVSGLALLILMAIIVRPGDPFESFCGAAHRHDLGKLLFGFICFWAYIAFSQFLLIWYANIPEETEWYAIRMRGGWRLMTLILALGHFVVPFFFLLSREVKRRRATLAAAAFWILLMHYADLYWLIMPNLHRGGPRLQPVDALTLMGVAAIATAVVAHFLFSSPRVAAGDPAFAESFAHGV